MEAYLALFVMFAVVLAVAAAFLIGTHVLGPRKRDPVKDAPYESGVDPLGRTRIRVSVHYYLIGILFVVFDVEAVFLFSWAVVYRKLLSTGNFILIEMLVFIAILFVAYIYALRRGALEWESKSS